MSIPHGINEIRSLLDKTNANDCTWKAEAGSVYTTNPYPNVNYDDPSDGESLFEDKYTSQEHCELIALLLNNAQALCDLVEAAQQVRNLYIYSDNAPLPYLVEGEFEAGRDLGYERAADIVSDILDRLT